MTRRALFAAALLTLLAGSAHAVPRLSVTAGSPCITCHVSPTGGGMRNEVGWGSMYRVGALTFDKIGLDLVHEQKSNQFFGDTTAVGLDARFQYIRLGVPYRDPATSKIVEPDAEILKMQLQPYLSVRPIEQVTLSASYGGDPNTFGYNGGDAKFCDPVYPGASCFTAEAQVEIAPGLPTVRAGMFQPAIGIRHDDHTRLTRARLPPNYAEWGGEVDYQPTSWLRAEVNVAGASNLEEAAPAADVGPVAYGGRLTFLPLLSFGGKEAAPKASDDEFGDDFGSDFGAAAPEPFVVNTWIGASYYASGDYLLLTGFASAGIHQGAELHFEVAYSKQGEDYTYSAGTVGASYAIFDWLVPFGRAELSTETVAGTDRGATQYVAGLEFFPLPYVELRPEYRIVKTDAFLFGQPAVQLHLFY